jgi:hypothetical protein
VVKYEQQCRLASDMSIGETHFSMLVCVAIQYFERLVIWQTFLDFSKSNGDLVNLEIRP